MSFTKVLIANRGAIAVRIIRTLNAMGIKAVAIYHEADRKSLHVRHADEAYSLGEGSAAETYLNIDAILKIARESGAQAIHPGYGFLSENTQFVTRCEEAGIAFIGPTAEQIDLFGLKHQARAAAQQAKVPLVPGSDLLTDLDSACQAAAEIGYPIMLKSTAGGGGIGMQVCDSESALRKAWDAVKRLSANYFANDGVFLEKYIARARHIEVQIFGDGRGQAVALGERDCSAQRRNQKVIEETPAPNLSEALRKELWDTAEALMASVSYRNAGTVEFIFDADAQQFYFLEVNTRLQVEHGVTEEVWGVDLVNWMVSLAAGDLAPLEELKAPLSPKGHAIQVRVYAEDAQADFRPSAGLLSHVDFSACDSLRVDTWVESGTDIPALFDPMIAKVICHQASREAALETLQHALDDTVLYGIETNLDYLRFLLGIDESQNGTLLTHTLSTLSFNPAAFRVLQPGTLTTIQDVPGRKGYWDIGVPPSGPMDNFHFRLANRLLDNDTSCPALEITLNGPELEFYCATRAVLCGAEFELWLNDTPVKHNEVFSIPAGSVLRIGKVLSSGARAYLALEGGIQCPLYLGSASTFTLGQFGGHNGRALRTGDVLKLADAEPQTAGDAANTLPNFLTETQYLRVIYGPHGATEFFTENDIDTFFAHEWEVHYNSSRTGVRLIGPKPEWARDNGGEAGLHPSNIHDNAYAFGSVDFTGDMPVILGPDGPSLGGFVCPATVISADLWKLGQLKAGDRFRFIPVTIEQAVEAERNQNQALEALAFVPTAKPEASTLSSPVVSKGQFQGDDVQVRVAGDQFVLVEIGPMELDIERRFKVHALMLWLEEHRLPGMEELTPGIRSLQIHYDSQALNLNTLLEHIARATEALAQQENPSVPARVVHLPLSWDDEACHLAIEKYEQSVRPGAPWCPSNLEFIRRINGLDSIQDVKDILFDASYLVMGLGDVYLGAPVATPLDPRHRLVTTKYNPARTWTAENSVGIGGAYLCIYGMEGPGGYQFVGRTLQMWNRYRQTQEFPKPWLLRFFDQIKFYEVSHDELEDIRKRFPLGEYPIRIEETEFSLAEYRRFLDEHQGDIDDFETQRTTAFEEELARWRRDGQLTFEAPEQDASDSAMDTLPDGVIAVDSPVSGSVWQLEVEVGQPVKRGDVLMILESMKMEIEISSPVDGRVHTLHAKKGSGISSGQALLWIEENTDDA